jgi:CTP:molybdopterin cytidylyltransferase MocA
VSQTPARRGTPARLTHAGPPGHADMPGHAGAPEHGAATLASVQSRIAGILLAAGEGSRLGQPKALVEIGGELLAARGAALLSDGGADPVIVVTGATAVDLTGVIVVHNPRWRCGMGSSLAAGLATAPDSCDAAVVALVDQPLVGPGAVARLIAAYLAGASVAVAAYRGELRNPVLLGREHWAEVTALAVGDEGARPFLRAHPELVTAVECGDTGSPDDVDTRADLERISRLLQPDARPGGPRPGAPRPAGSGR